MTRQGIIKYFKSYYKLHQIFFKDIQPVPPEAIDKVVKELEGMTPTQSQGIKDQLNMDCIDAETYIDVDPICSLAYIDVATHRCDNCNLLYPDFYKYCNQLPIVANDYTLPMNIAGEVILKDCLNLEIPE